MRRTASLCILTAAVVIIVIQGCRTDTVESRRALASHMYLRTGMSLLETNHRTEALAAFESATTANPADYEVHRAVIALLLGSEMFPEGIRSIEKALHRPHGDPRSSQGMMDRIRDSELYVFLGDSYCRLRMIRKAEAAYREAVRLNDKNAVAYNDWGYMYADLGVELDQALKMTQRAVELDPNNGCFIDSVGWAYFKMGRVGEAVEYLSKAVSLLPRDAEVRAHLGSAYEAAGNPGAALVEFSKALRLSPDDRAVWKRVQHLYQESA